MVPKDRSRDPFTCYSREWKVDYEDAMNANEVTHGWCGTCDPSAGEKGRVLSSELRRLDDNTMLQSLATAAVLGTMLRRTSRDPHPTLNGDIALRIVKIEAAGLV